MPSNVEPLHVESAPDETSKEESKPFVYVVQDEEWSEELHKYKASWIALIVCYCTPCFCIFSYSIIMSIWYGGWWNTSGGQPYVVKEKDEDTYINTYYGLPQVLTTHMAFAVPMLFTLIAQVTTAYLGVVKGNRTAMGIHARFTGPTAIFLMFLCVSLGIVALSFCDINPKRGPQTLFFCWIGVGIITLGARGLQYAAEGLYGLHMQYMSIAICLTFTPGWNRITTVGVRAYHHFMQGDAYSQRCFVANGWAARGYNYTLSFMLGGGILFLLWLTPCPGNPFRAPLFKKWSYGFFYIMMLAAFMAACAYQLAYEWVDGQPPFFAPLDCSPEFIDRFHNWTNTMKLEGMFQPQLAYGMCAVTDRTKLQGLPSGDKIFRVDGVVDIPQYR